LSTSILPFYCYVQDIVVTNIHLSTSILAFYCYVQDIAVTNIDFLSLHYLPIIVPFRIFIYHVSMSWNNLWMCHIVLVPIVYLLYATSISLLLEGRRLGVLCSKPKVKRAWMYLLVTSMAVNIWPRCTKEEMFCIILISLNAVPYFCFSVIIVEDGQMLSKHYTCKYVCSMGLYLVPILHILWKRKKAL